MQLKKLKDAIFGAAEIVEAGGSRAAAKDVRKITEAFAGSDDQPSDAAISELKELLAYEKRLKVDSYVAQLNAAGTDRAAFTKVHAALTKDKNVAKVDMDEIMHAYGGGRLRWPTRKAAIDAIKKKFNERAYRESKMNIVEKTRVW